MKINYYLITVLSLFLCLSCSDDDNDNPDNNNNNTDIFVRFTANGTDYDFPDPAIAQSANTTINGSLTENGVITESISIWFPNGFTTGTFQFTGDFGDPGDYKVFYDSVDLGIDGFAPTTGEVTISSISNGFIEGTFFFSGMDNGVSVDVTNGTFRSFTLD
ncbi:MAG: hypothetical protein AAF688_12110 [Bacteroidota bacterium]